MATLTHEPSNRAADNVVRAVNPLLSLSYVAGRCWLSCRGCGDGDGTATHWHEITRGMFRCLGGGEPWA